MRAPGLSWGVMLKMTKIELEIIPDSDMYIFFETGTRDGISCISNRYSKTNNKYLKSYDSEHESKYSTYLDVNNLHGHAMSKFLSTSGFKWIDPKESDLNRHKSNSSKRCALEVDLEYPKSYESYAMSFLKLQTK